jgi:hypothetical protein
VHRQGEANARWGSEGARIGRLGTLLYALSNEVIDARELALEEG